MRYRSGSTILLASVALAACSANEDRSAPSEQMTAEEARAPAGVAVTAAPGVAFNYRYAFTLPASAVSTAQETHAAACEQLGIARCRITGMRYRLLGENRVEAMLAFKLDPAIARTFGKQGIAAIEKAEGRLVDAEITGTDAGAEIARLAAERGRTQEQVKRIDDALSRAGLPASERAELQRQRAEMVGQAASNRSAADEQRESLANTPMVFDYASGRAVRGFDAGAPLSSALDLLAGSAQATLAFVLGALAVLGPPALALLLGLLAWRWIRPRFKRARD